MKIKTSNIFLNMIIFYPVLFSLAMIISDGLARNFAQAILVTLIIFILKRGKKQDFLALAGVGLLIAVNALRFGVAYIIHQDFYGYVLLLLIFLYFKDENKTRKLEYLLLKKNIIIAVVIAYLGVLLFSILFMNGLQHSSEWGVSLPLLYGVFGLPHSTAYQLIILYMMLSILFHRYGERKYLFLMCVVVLCIMWTGVRSAFLATAILCLLDYKSLKSVSTKYLIIILIGFVVLYLGLFTDILINNPVIQKTIVAAGKPSGISNSRGDFMTYLLGIFIRSTSLFEKLFGIGMDNLRHFMYLRYGTELHAHNDLFNAVLGMGLIGLMFYVKSYFDFCKNNKKPLYVFIILFILLFTNGLYMYLAFTPCIPIVCIYVNCLAKGKNENG